MKLPLPRGIRDIPPDVYREYLWLLDVFKENCRLYDFKIMEPATIEYFEVLSKKSGPDIANEVYEFKDKAGRHLGLRFDLTVGLTRYVVSNPQLSKPIKLAAFSVQWRYDEPQYGRYRSFYAWDIEIYGAEETYSAVETISFTIEFLSSLGLRKFKVLISDRRLVEQCIKLVNENVDAITVMRILDKWGKLSKNEILEMLVKNGKLNYSEAEELIRWLFIEKRIKDDLLEEYAENLIAVHDMLREIGCNNVVIDPSIIRGLDYYDGLVFEVKSEADPSLGSIVGGGNYSTLVKLFGGDFNAFGAAGGVERTILAMKAEKIDVNITEKPDIFIAVTSPSLAVEAFKLGNILRQNGIKTYTPLKIMSLNKQIKHAIKTEARYILFIGKEEIRKKKYTLKNLTTREEYKYSLNEILNIFKK